MQSFSSHISSNSIKEAIESFNASVLYQQNLKGSCSDLSKASKMTKNWTREYSALYANFHETLISIANKDKTRVFLNNRFAITADFTGIEGGEVQDKMLKASDILHQKDNCIVNPQLKEIAIKIEADIGCQYLEELRKNIMMQCAGETRETGITKKINEHLDMYLSNTVEIKVLKIHKIKFLHKIPNHKEEGNKITLISIRDDKGRLNRLLKGMPGIKDRKPELKIEDQHSNPMKTEDKGKAQEVIQEERTNRSYYTTTEKSSFNKELLKCLDQTAKDDINSKENSKLSYQHSQSKTSKKPNNSELDRKYLQDRSSQDNLKLSTVDCNGVQSITMTTINDRSSAYKEPTFPVKKKATVYPTANKTSLPFECIEALKEGKRIILKDTRENEIKIKGLLTQQMILELDQSKMDNGKKIHKREE